MALIQVDDGLFIDPEMVIAVKSPSKDAKTCSVFCIGQSAVDGGFFVNREIGEVLDDIADAMDKDDE